MRRRSVITALGVGAGALLLAACSKPDPTRSTVTVRLWDPQVAKAYRHSLDAFERTHPDIRVLVRVVPYADYFTRLRLDVSTGSVDDIFWTNASSFLGYARAGALVDVSNIVDGKAPGGWVPQVVRQYTDRGSLWGVPQLTDPGIGLLVNRTLLGQAGIPLRAVEDLRWDPSAASDLLRTVARRLTVDVAGRNAADPAFDPTRVRQYGYSASNDLNAITLQFLGGNGAAWQSGDRFDFDSIRGRAAFQYVVDLINRDHIAPPASQTNPPNGGSAALDLFLQSRIALFQTGAYNLANVQQAARFDWSVAPLPAGPVGAVSVTNGVVASAWARSRHPEAQREVLRWLGSAEGSAPIGARGAALPAVTAAQASYFAYWRKKRVDVAPLIDVLRNGFIQAPQGMNYAAAAAASDPILNQVFLGQLPVASGLRQAQSAANAAALG